MQPKLKMFLTLMLLSFCTSIMASIDMKKVDSLNRLLSTQSGKERIETLIALSDIYRKLSPDQSYKTDTLAINYADEEGLENMKGVILLSMGKTANVSGDFSLALDYFGKAIQALKKTDNYADLCRAYINTGIVHKNMGDAGEASVFFEEAIKLATQQSLQDQLASALTNRAILFYSSGNYDSAAENYQKALRLYKELNDTSRYALLTMNLGLVYWQWNKNELALQMLLEAKDVLEKTNQTAELGKLYNNLGRLYSQDLQDNEKALEYYQRSLEIRELTGNQLGIAVVLANIGRIHSDMMQNDKAITQLKRSLQISKMIGYKEGEALAHYYLGLIYKTDKKYAVSNNYMDSALIIAREHGFSAYFRLVNEAKLTNYFKLQDDSAFVREYKVFAMSYDSTINSLAELRFQQTELQNAANELKSENESLQLLTEEQSDKISAYRVVIFLLVIVLTIALFLCLRKHKKEQ